MTSVPASSMHADFAIVGAGCAGLSLAVQLRQQPALKGRRLLVIEPRTTYTRDRSWCYWNVASHAFESAVSCDWAQWSIVSANGHETRRFSHNYRYKYVDSGVFYAKALELLRADSHVELRLGEGLQSIEEHAEFVELKTESECYRTRWVFDSRPPMFGKVPVGEIRLWQHFYGQCVRTERPVFDPTAVTLMDFQVDQTKGVHFMYVLPFDAHHALVEDTYMSPNVVTQETYAASLRNYLKTRYSLDAWEVQWDEQGKIPMTTESLMPRHYNRIIPIGIRGGLAKPSTGYAFMAIQEFSQQLAHHLATHGELIVPTSRSRWSQWLDHVFLRFLAEHPDQGSQVFTSLFANVPADTLVRFLTDRGSLADNLSVMKAMPARPLTTQAFRMLRL
jgi:lycopene beta-cyclase